MEAEEALQRDLLGVFFEVPAVEHVIEQSGVFLQPRDEVLQLPLVEELRLTENPVQREDQHDLLLDLRLVRLLAAETLLLLLQLRDVLLQLLDLLLVALH